MKRAISAALLTSTALLAPGAAALLTALGCSSSSSRPCGVPGWDGRIACVCADGESGTQSCGAASCSCGGASDAGAGADSGLHIGDGGHVEDGATPGSLYGSCALTGSFGWPCAQANAIDSVDCTDPRFPYCFAGGQGSWCTAICEDAGFSASCLIEDAGCTPTACNTKGYCK